MVLKPRARMRGPHGFCPSSPYPHCCAVCQRKVVCKKHAPTVSVHVLFLISSFTSSTPTVFQIGHCRAAGYLPPVSFFQHAPLPDNIADIPTKPNIRRCHVMLDLSSSDPILTWIASLGTSNAPPANHPNIVSWPRSC